MAEYDFIKMQKKLAKYLDEDRYEHTLGVMFTCAALAMVLAIVIFLMLFIYTKLGGDLDDLGA